MEIIFSRHGNTFEPNELATWAGCMNDLPLVEVGTEQAKVLARALNQSNTVLNAIYCGPLQRTRKYAQLILDEIQSNLKPIVDSRLNELDYGHWSGLTNQEISEKFGAEELEKWEKYCKWPVNSNWGSSEQKVCEEARSFAADLIKQHRQEDVILVISSNGKLRYFLNLISEEFEKRVRRKTIKIKTGNISSFSYANKKWSLNYWNRIPTEELFL